METQSNKLDFKGQNFYIGIDVHLKNWKVTIMSEKHEHKTFSQPPRPELLYEYLNRNFPGGTYYSAYEASFCGYWINNRLNKLGINSIVINAADIPTTDKEKVQKEDARDSRKIARCLRNGDLHPIYVPSSRTLEDRCLIRARAALVSDLTRNKSRIKQFLHFHGIEIPPAFANPRWSKRFINWLERVDMEEQSGKDSISSLITAAKNLRTLILEITKKINNLSKSEPYSETATYLKTVPGIGILTAMTIMTELETINRFKSFDKLCAFIGLVPSTNSSGDNEVIRGITPRGHAVLRKAIIESSWIAVRRDPALMKSYHEYCKRMEPNKAIIRIARKLLNRIRFVIKNKQDYVCSVVK